MNLRDRLCAPRDQRIRLGRIDPGGTPGARDKDEAQVEVEKNLPKLFDLQYRLYAENRRSLLVVLQAMDTAGKDGVIRYVFAGLNPQGCAVTAFKVPSAEESGHDFLWRVHRAVPSRGDIGIFNRSHYEEVLVVRVHDLVPKKVWSKRYEQINAFEKYLADDHTVIVKLFLHISKKEQLERLKARVADPLKQWKFSEGDLAERRRWDDYVEAYEDAIEKCNRPWAPWYIIPADHKWYRNFAVSRILVETLQEMDPRIPPPSIDAKKIRLR